MPKQTHDTMTLRTPGNSPCVGAFSRRPKQFLALAAASAALVGGCGKGVSEATIQYVGLDEVRELQTADQSAPSTLLLIDPRPLRRYAEGHLPGALTLQLNEAPSYGGRDSRLAGHSHLIVYGENPASPTARAMTKRLLAIGYSGVRMFPGGIEAWLAADLPVETSPMPPSEE